MPLGRRPLTFKLPGTDGKTYTLASFKKCRFTGHCLYSVIIVQPHRRDEDRIIQLTSDYSAKNVTVVAISPNDPKSVRLDELGYTDLSDSYEEMKLRGQTKEI